MKLHLIALATMLWYAGGNPIANLNYQASVTPQEKPENKDSKQGDERARTFVVAFGVYKSVLDALGKVGIPTRCSTSHGLASFEVRKSDLARAKMVVKAEARKRGFKVWFEDSFYVFEQNPRGGFFLIAAVNESAMVKAALEKAGIAFEMEGGPDIRVRKSDIVRAMDVLKQDARQHKYSVRFNELW